MKKVLLMLTALAALTITSCKKDHNKAEGNVNIAFENVVDGVHVDVTGGTSYIDASGDTFTVTKLRYYISNVELKKSDGTWYAIPNSYFLVDEADTASVECTLEAVPGGDYTAVRYLVGVDSATNASGATGQTGALDPANGMYWTWNTGYIFFKIEGHSPSAMGGEFMYHIGGYSAASGGNAIRQVEKDFGGATLTVDGDREAEIHLTADVQKFLGNVDMSMNSMVMSPAGAATFADNYAGMFEFEHIHNGE